MSAASLELAAQLTGRLHRWLDTRAKMAALADGAVADDARGGAPKLRVVAPYPDGNHSSPADRHLAIVTRSPW